MQRPVPTSSDGGAPGPIVLDRRGPPNGPRATETDGEQGFTDATDPDQAEPGDLGRGCRDDRPPETGTNGLGQSPLGTVLAASSRPQEWITLPA